MDIQAVVDALLSGARLGIIGAGVLGQRVAEIARVFGMTPLFAGHKGKSGLGSLYTPWEQVLETSDVITLHLLLTKETRGGFLIFSVNRSVLASTSAGWVRSAVSMASR